MFIFEITLGYQVWVFCPLLFRICLFICMIEFVWPVTMMSVWSRGPSAVNLQNSRELYTSTAVVGVSCELYLLARRTLDCRPLYLFLHNPVPPAPQLANFCNTRRCILNENNLFAEDFTSRDNKGQLLAACGKLWLLMPHIFEPRNIFVPSTPPLHLCTPFTSFTFLYLLHLLFIFVPPTPQRCTFWCCVLLLPAWFRLT